MVKRSARPPRGCCSGGSAACRAGTRTSGRQSTSAADPWAVSAVSGGHRRSTTERRGGWLGENSVDFILQCYLSIWVSKVNDVNVCFGMVQELL